MEVAMGEVAGWVVVWVLTWIACRTIIAKTSSTKKRELPPGPKGWPVLGCLPVLGKMPHVTLTEMRDKYGPVVYLKLGTSGMVVANTPAAAKAFLKTLDLNFSNRPGNAGATLLAYDSQDMVWAPYGPRWTHLRKLSNLHMLGGKALDDFAPARESEVAAMLRSILSSAQNGETVVLPDLINVCAANIVGQIMLKKRVFHQKGEESNEFKDMVVELMTTAGYFNIGDFIPSVAWLDLQGIQRGMKKLHKKWDALISKMITDHQNDKHKIKDETFLDILLAQKNVPEAQGRRLNDVHIKALLLNLFSAGTDTSSSVVEWTIAEAINNPEIMKKAHAELDEVVGRDRKVTTKDLDSLKYIRAMCKEGFRKHPSTPLSLPRVADEACDVGGYYIPKDTRLMVNIWGIGRDPAIWEKPEVFDPDRFLEGVGPHAKVDPRGNDFELIPFGAGRRICAGTRMGIAMVEFEVASLIHGFEWDVPSPAHRPMNMDEAFGLALQKAIPLEARVTPRLPLHLY